MEQYSDDTDEHWYSEVFVDARTHVTRNLQHKASGHGVNVCVLGYAPIDIFPADVEHILFHYLHSISRISNSFSSLSLKFIERYRHTSINMIFHTS